MVVIDPTPTRSPGGFVATLVLPTYNASAFVEETVARLQRFAAAHDDWCVLFVCDGCSDDTVPKLRQLLDGSSHQLRVEAYDRNRGKGYALRRGMTLAETPYKIYTDCDLAYDPEEAVKILHLLQAGADLAVVNRASPDSSIPHQPARFPEHLQAASDEPELQLVAADRCCRSRSATPRPASRDAPPAAWDVVGPAMTTDGFFFDVELLARAGRGQAADRRITGLLQVFTTPLPCEWSTTAGA